MRTSQRGMAYWEYGEGMPLLCLHGYYPDHRIMEGCLEPLFDPLGRAAIPPSAIAGRPEGGPSRLAYRRVYPDLPFMGQSEDPEEVRTSDDMLAWVLDFIEEVLPPGPFLLAGESYGGYLARGLARALPERVAGILFICPMIVAQGKARDLPAHGPGLVEPGYATGLTPAQIEDFESVAVVRDRYCLGRAMKEVIPGVEAARADSLEALRARGYGFSFDRLGSAAEGGEAFDPSFPKPCLFFLGRADASTGWRDALRLAGRYPGASYAILEGGGHNLQIEAAGLFASLVGEWLGRCELAANP